MTPSSFRFQLSMPRDRRLLGAVRDLASHAGSYAQMDAAAAASLVDRVADAVEALIGTTHAPEAPLQVTFDREGRALRVAISGPVADTGPVPARASAGALTVEWSEDGGRRTCTIHHTLSS